jgi:serine/threonine-protein kinase
MELPGSPQNRRAQYDSPSDRDALGGSVSLFLRLWSYGGPAQPPNGLALEKYPEIAELIRKIVHEGKGAIAERQPELFSAHFDSALQALLAAKALQRHFLTFHRKAEPQQVVPSILIYSTKDEKVPGADATAPEDMLENVTSAQILVSNSIYEQVKSVPGLQFNHQPVREAGETFCPEAIYELLWTDESTYGHLRQATRSSLDNVGRYRIQEELGRGAMGAVYKAYDRIIGRTVALKTISIDRNSPDRDELVERLKQEAKAAGKLDHPNIITIYDVAQEDDVVYLSMQFVEGKTLLTLLAEEGVPSLPTFISWADQISSAVGFAHAHGVIHRDLKPANLMLTSQGVIKVLDFGIAKVENASLTQTGLVVGTPSYMAPEQVAGKKVDFRADIFALGSVFYELVTREKPFRGDVATILYKIMDEDPVAPSLINPALPGSIDAIIRKALAKDPNERFQTCEEMRHAFLEQSALLKITPAAGGPGVRAVPKPAPPASATIPKFLLQYDAPRRSRRIWPSMVVGLVLAIVGTTSWAFYTRSLTGSFPPVVNKLVSSFHRLLPPPSNTVKPEEPAGQQPSVSVSDQRKSSAVNDPASAVTSSGTPASGAPNSNGAHTGSEQATSQSSGASTAPPQEQTAGQSSSSQTASSQTTSDGAHVPAAATSVSSAPGPAQAPQSSNASDQPVISPSPPAIQRSDEAKPAAERANALSPFAPKGDRAKSLVNSDTGESQAAPASATKSVNKPKPEPALTVDGFSRQDVPELLRQADAAAGRGDYRLARYEYTLILKLDRANATAREGLTRVQAADTSH